MRTKKFTASRAIIRQFKVQRQLLLQRIGKAKYQELVTTHFPKIRQIMIEENCDSIIAACHLALTQDFPTQFDKNLVACAGYDLALAA